MPDQLIGLNGSTVVDVRAIAGSNALYVYDTSAGTGTTNILGSVEVSSVVKPVTIVGSPNYALPIIGSQFVTQGTSPWNVIGSVQTSNLQNPHPIIGSVQVSSIVANIGVTQQTSPWTTEGSVIQKGTWYNNIIGSPNYSLPIIGSVQVSSIVNALPAGTALLGSVVSTPVGTQTVLGSVQVSSINAALPAGTAIIGSVAVDIQKFGVSLPAGTALLGSVVNKTEPYNLNSQGTTWVTTTSTTLLQPRVGRKYFEVVATGSYSSAFTSGRIWYSPSGTALVQNAAERLLNHPWGLPYYEGSVTAITDAGSIVVAKYEVF